MGENGLTPADIAAVNGNENGWGGMIWLFAILALMGGGFGWNNGGNGNANAIQNDINRGFDNQNLQAQTRDILAAVTAGTAQSVATTNQVYHDLMNGLSDKYNELQRDIAGLAVGQANQLARFNECCCETKQAIAQANYDAAMRDAATNANIVAQNQKILDAIMGNKIEALQNRVNQLELQNQLQNVVRYPQGFTYNAGNSPFCGGCNNM